MRVDVLEGRSTHWPRGIRAWRTRRPDEPRSIEAATEGLPGLFGDGTPVAIALDEPRGRLERLVRLGFVVFLLVAVASTIAPGLAPGDVVLGHTKDAHRLTATGGDGRLLVATVSVRAPTPIDLVRSWFDDDVVFVAREDEGGRAEGAAAGWSAEGFSVDRRAAWAAARGCVGLDASENRPSAPYRPVYGASGGLMLALAYVEEITDERVSRGPVAGTGVIDADGRVGAVRAVREKVRGAAKAGAPLFLVPASQIGGAEEAETGLRVIGVESLDDALGALGGPGCAVRGPDR